MASGSGRALRCQTRGGQDGARTSMGIEALQLEEIHWTMVSIDT
jgi:hypothetical protein